MDRYPAAPHTCYPPGQMDTDPTNTLAGILAVGNRDDTVVDKAAVDTYAVGTAALPP